MFIFNGYAISQPSVFSLQSPVASQQSSVASLQSPVASLQSPITGHQLPSTLELLLHIEKEPLVAFTVKGVLEPEHKVIGGYQIESGTGAYEKFVCKS